MTPADYLRLIVLPTLAELLAAPDDQRRAYLACITAAHLVDHVAVTLPRRPGGRPDLRSVRAAVGRIGLRLFSGCRGAVPPPPPSPGVLTPISWRFEQPAVIRPSASGMTTLPWAAMSSSSGKVRAWPHRAQDTVTEALPAARSSDRNMPV